MLFINLNIHKFLKYYIVLFVMFNTCICIILISFLTLVLDDEATKFPANLQEAKMGLINDTVCGADSDIAAVGLYEDIMLCAGYIHGYITVCNVSVFLNRS